MRCCSRVGGVLFAVLLLAASAVAAGLELELSAAVRESERVVHARIRSTESFRGTVNGQVGIFTRVEADVLETYRGPIVSSVQFMLVGGVVADRAIVASHQPSFRAGEEAVIFLFRGGEVLFPLSELGKWSVSTSAEGVRVASTRVDEWSGEPPRVVEVPLLELRDFVGRQSVRGER